VKTPFVIGGDGLAQFDEAGVGGVLRFALAQRLNARLADTCRRLEVGLAYPEGNDVVHRRDDVEKLADARRFDVFDFLVEFALVIHCAAPCKVSREVRFIA